MKSSRAGRRLSCGSLHTSAAPSTSTQVSPVPAIIHGADVEAVMVTWRLGAIAASSATVAYTAARTSIPARVWI